MEAMTQPTRLLQQLITRPGSPDPAVSQSPYGNVSRSHFHAVFQMSAAWPHTHLAYLSDSFSRSPNPPLLTLSLSLWVSMRCLPQILRYSESREDICDLKVFFFFKFTHATLSHACETLSPSSQSHIDYPSECFHIKAQASEIKATCELLLLASKLLTRHSLKLTFLILSAYLCHTRREKNNKKIFIISYFFPTSVVFLQLLWGMHNQLKKYFSSSEISGGN